MCLLVTLELKKAIGAIYDSNTRRYYVSADVTFFEDIPYYSKEGKSLDSSGLDEIPLPTSTYPPIIIPPPNIRHEFQKVYQRRHKQIPTIQLETEPPRFAIQGEQHHICKLKKAIYGLKQSPRA